MAVRINGVKLKYKNAKTRRDGINFDSKKESTRYLQLKMLEKAKVISGLELQKRFELQPSYKINSKTVRKIEYIADFYYYDNELKRWIVEDTKGYKTDIYKLKKKLFEYKYGIEIKES